MGGKLCAWDLMDLKGDVAQLVMQAGLSGPLPESAHLQNDEGDTSHGDSVSQLASLLDTVQWSVLSTPAVTLMLLS